MRTQHLVLSKAACLILVISAAGAMGQQLFPQVPSMSRPLVDNPKTLWGTEYTNWVEVGFGGAWTEGSEAEFQRRHYLPDGMFGGIEDFHLEQAISDTDRFEVDGRAMVGTEDYSLQLGYTRQGLGFVRAGFRQYRVWYDRHGGYLPRTDTWLEPFERDVRLDRGELWFETGLRIEDTPEITFRYSHQYRDGKKDSTIWGDFSPARLAIVPGYRILDEDRDIFDLRARHTISATTFGGGARYELSDQDNELRYLRRPGENYPLGPAPNFGAERYTTQREEVDTDVFGANAFLEHRISPHALFTTGYAFTRLGTDLSGNRIIGEGFEAGFDPVFERRQARDEGYYGLSGGGDLYQHAANLNLLLTPWDNFSILPGVRFTAEKEEADSWFTETAVAPPPGPPTTGLFPMHAENDNDWMDVTGVLELRYTGLTNWAFYTRGEWTAGEGDQKEWDYPGDEDAGPLVQDVEQERFIQKYVAGLNWYPLRRVNLGLQYYHKIRDSEYDPFSEMVTGRTNYPGLIRDQDFETDDVNVRLTLRPLSNLTLVSRYDLQYSTIDTTAGAYGSIESAEMTSHIFSQSISWAPFSRLYFQLFGSLALDETETPMNDSDTGMPNLVRKARNNYFNGSALVGLSLDDRTDLQFQYFMYYSDNDTDQNVDSIPYNSSSEEHGVSATLARQLTSALRWTLKYGFFTNNDDLFGGNKDYTAHMVYSTVQMRF